MNVTPMCECDVPVSAFPKTGEVVETIGCDLRAEWDVFNKTTGQRYLVCKQHLTTFIVAGHTFTISPARSLAKRDGKGFTIGEAQRLRICRVCGEPGNPKRREDGKMNPFVLGFGYEHAHEDCLDDEAKKHLESVLSKRGPFRGD